MMNFEHFKKIVNQLYKINKKAKKWIDKVPSEVNVVFFDNPYVDAFNMIRDVLIPETFGDLAEDVFWLLDEFEEGKDHHCKIDDVEYNIRTLNDFFASVKSRFEQ